MNYLGAWVIRAIALGHASQYKKIFSFLASFTANFSIAFLGRTNTGIFELELAVLEWLPMWRRVCCEIHGIFFFHSFYFFPLQNYYFALEVHSIPRENLLLCLNTVLLSGCYRTQ